MLKREIRIRKTPLTDKVLTGEDSYTTSRQITYLSPSSSRTEQKTEKKGDVIRIKEEKEMTV